MYGLKKVLSLIEDEGLETRWERHKNMSEYTRNWVENHQQELFTSPDAISYTLTCIKNVQEWNIEKINEELLSKGFRMDRGYGKFRFKTFRIPHMGNVYMEDLREYLNVFESVICQ